MAGITENESVLIAIFIQSCVWGGFVVMFTLTWWTLIYRRPRGRPLNAPMLFIAIFMFVLATVQLGIYFTRIIRGFIIHESHTEDYYNQLAEFTNVFGSALYDVQTFVGDGVALYRCYIVWNRRLVFIILPGLTFIGCIVSGIGALVNMGRANADDLVFAQTVKHWITSFFSLTLATSTICTLMIASRIWYLCDQSISHGGTRSSLHPIALVVVESGAIYSGLLIALIILYVQDSWFHYVIVDSLASVIGIVFSIIIVRIGLGIAVDPDTLQGTAHSKSPGGSDTHVDVLSTFHARTGPLSTAASDHPSPHHHHRRRAKSQGDVESLKYNSVEFKTQV